MNSAKACEAGAAQDVGKNGFRLIVEGVRGGDAIHDFGSDELLEKCVARAAARVFKIHFVTARFCGDVRSRKVKRQAEFLRELRDKSLVRVRSLPAQFVIEVNDANDNAKPFAQFEQKAQQRDGIRSAGHCDAEAKAGLQPGLALQVLFELYCQARALHSRAYFSVHHRTKAARKDCAAANSGQKTERRPVWATKALRRGSRLIFRNENY
jgi:hypothetical protein